MKKLVDSFAKVIEAFLVILMALMVLVVFLATVGRYSQLFAIPWSEEFARYCMVAIVYLGLMLASLQERHFIVDLVPLLFRKSPRIILGANVVVTVLLDVFAVFMARYGWDIVSKMLAQGKLSPMLKLPLGGVYALIPVGIVLMAVFYTYHMAQKIRDDSTGGQVKTEEEVTL